MHCVFKWSTLQLSQIIVEEILEFKLQARLSALQRDLEFETATENSNTKPHELLDKDVVSRMPE